ncbi:MAG: tyrosine-type recombinase/integrase [Bacteroidia bacterium]|nr:tyrosine-type recombinase/integrase [Bacteroidia bacterium]
MKSKVWLQKRANGYYYARYQLPDGSEKWRSTGKRTKREAMAFVQAHAEPQKKLVPVRLVTFADRVCEYVKANQAYRTFLSYDLALRSFIRIIGDKMLEDVTRADVDKFKIARMSEISSITVNIQLRSLRAIFNLGVRWELMQSNPFTNVKMIRLPERVPVFLTRDQFSKLRVTIDGHWMQDIIVFAVCTGMRQGEILNLQWRQVDLERRVVHVTNTESFKTKTGRGRIVPLNDLAVKTLEGRSRKWDLVFTYKGRPIRADSLRHLFKRAVRRAELPEAIHFHSLRHTFASWLVQDGVSLFQVGRLLGHSDSKTTEIYAHLQPETMHDVVSRLKL